MRDQDDDGDLIEAGEFAVTIGDILLGRLGNKYPEFHGWTVEAFGTGFIDIVTHDGCFRLTVERVRE